MNSALTHLRRAVSITATLCMAVAHAGFLWRRVADESLTEPAVLARWLGAALLLGVFVAVQRTRSARSSHAILVLCLVVALLHVTIPAGERILDADLSLIFQTGLAALPAGLLLAALLVVVRERDRRVLFHLGADRSLAWSLPARLTDATRAPPLR